MQMIIGLSHPLPGANVNLKSKLFFSFFFSFKDTLAVLFFSSFLKWIQAPPLQTRGSERKGTSQSSSTD